MRLTSRQIDTIKQTTLEIFGETTEVWLFGSRTDDHRRGGDIDLLIRPPACDGKQALLKKVRLLARLEQRLGERKIDIIIETPDDTRPIVRIAHQQGILL
uniref:Nucleotidyltransferase domain-containing protein n=1 Tax=Candidatus Kentrum sp. LFY TaxID=2126342 RepID=A0A450WLW5_9GAMM|nr:MAG: Nucleotidyltransferase domain-containing protein [Candidatus Kentron sp. LFY]VFK18041.1 MAG: Nucleotidyltransferase domain-containing protein [Candidatus Kentron sp. LFY]